MAPSAGDENGSNPVPDASRGQNQSKATSSSDNASQNDKFEAPKEEKLSGKELKVKAKAEKAARRANEKHVQQGQPFVDLGKTKQINEHPSTKTTTTTSGSRPQLEVQHEKTGPTKTGPTGSKPQELPLRPKAGSISSAEEVPKKENKKVPFLEHLYGPPRRTTIAGAGKDVHHAVLALGLQMGSYTICGSNSRCVATLLAFKRVIESYVTPPHISLPRHLTSHLSSQIEYIVSCRPMSISMGNAIRWLKLRISAVDVSTEESTAKTELCSAIDNFIQEKIILADQVISRKASERIKDGDVVLTFAKSSVVQQTLLEAFKQGKKFRVIIVDSAPLYEGKNLASALIDLGLEVQYSSYDELTIAVIDADKVFLGAHAMMSNGKLYSRVGTAMMAMMAEQAHIPVIVCCESIKFTERCDLDSLSHNEIGPSEELINQFNEASSLMASWEEIHNLHVLNIMYDLTPAEYINVVMTEYGPIPPTSVPAIQRMSTET